MTSRLSCAFSVSLLLLLLIEGRSATAAPSSDLLAPGNWFLSTPHPADASVRTLPADSAPVGGEGLLITVTNPADPLWMIQLSRGIPEAVPAGDQVRMHFWAKSATNNTMRVTIEQSAAPYQSIDNEMLALTPAWHAFTLEGVSPGWGPNGLSAHFQVGQQPGVIEIAGATVTDVGPDPGIAAAETALQPAQIQARIEKYRKGTLTVRVVDRLGKPVPYAVVQVTQTRHAFLFGCNFFGYDPSDSSPSQIAYRAQFAALFNYATLPFYWGAFEPQEGKPHYDRLQAMADWCVAHDITPKGHPLVWHQVWPGWAPSDADAAIPLLKARVSDLIPRYKSTIHYWDVLNEANGAAATTPINGESAWIRRDGPAPVVKTALEWAREAGDGPGVPETFLYNDYETGRSNVALLTSLQAAGSLPDAIGIQSHMHQGTWPLTKIWQVCETFKTFGKPIHFTETTVLSGPKRAMNMDGPPATDWVTTPEDEAKQADYVAQFYTILFSHPSVRAITWWDFSDLNSWGGAPAGLVRKDMSPKPAYTRLMDLIHHQWWTSESGKTDHRGTYTSRVFYGTYRVTVKDAKGRTKTQSVFFPEAAPPTSVTVSLP